jgi:hypothetical protein
MKRLLSSYLMLLVYGGVVWAVADEMRDRPGWAQWGSLFLWALIAWPFADGFFGRKNEE